MQSLFKLTSLSATGVGGSQSQGQLWLALIGVVVVILGAYYATWIISKRAGQVRQGRAVQILDRFAVDKNKMFCLIAMGDAIYLVGLTDGAVTVIDHLTGEEADQIRATCEQAQQSNILQRGASFLGRKSQSRRLDSSLEEARARFAARREQKTEAEPRLNFAREEDDIDAMLRQIAARRGKTNSDRDPGEGGDTP